MKISFILPSLNFSGGVKVVKQYCQKLNEFGHDCQIWYPLKTWRGSEPNCHCYISPRTMEFQIPEADIVIATAWETAQFVNDLPDKCGKKVYFVQHWEQFDHFSHGTPPKHEIDETYWLPLHHIYVSHFVWRLIPPENNNVQKGPTICHNGIELPEPREKDYSKPSILFPNRPEEWKGTKTALKVLEKIHDQYPQVPISCYGWSDIPMPDWINVYTRPDDEELSDLMWEHTIFYFPSWIEGFGLPPLEAAAHGCAVVCGNRKNAMPELFKQCEEYEMCFADDEESSFLLLMDFCKSMYSRNLFGHNAWVTAHQYTLDRAARRFEECLKNLL